MKKILIFLIPLIAFVAQVLRKFEVFKDEDIFTEKYKNCRYVEEITPGPEDITKYDETTLVFSAGDFMNLFEIGDPELTTPGAVYAIYNADQQNFSIQKLKMTEFPQDVAFFPHGIFIKKFPEGKYLYAVNHAFNKGGERIEVFKILQSEEGLSLQHSYSLTYPQEFNGILNDIVVLSPSHLLVTTYRPYPDDPNGRKNNGLLFDIKTLLIQLFNQQYTYGWSCRYTVSGKTVIPLCVAQMDTKSVTNNGITYDGKKSVFIPDTFANYVKRFTLDENGKKVLTYAETIETNGGGDNVEYDEATNKIYIGLIHKKIHHFTFVTMGKEGKGVIDKNSKPNLLTTAAEIDLDPKSKNYMKSVTVHNQLNLIKGCSATYQIGNNLFFGSYGDQSIAVCERK